MKRLLLLLTIIAAAAHAQTEIMECTIGKPAVAVVNFKDTAKVYSLLAHNDTRGLIAMARKNEVTKLPQGLFVTAIWTGRSDKWGAWVRVQPIGLPPAMQQMYWVRSNVLLPGRQHVGVAW